MKARNRLLIFSFVTTWCFVFAAHGYAASRASADGEVLPDITKDRPVDLKAPLIGNRIGDVPENFAPKIYSSSQSKALLEKRGKVRERLAWFGIGIANSDLAMFELRDGRVSLVCLAFSKMSDARLREIDSECKKFLDVASAGGWKATRGIPMHCFISRIGSGAEYIVGFKASEWYIITNDLRKEIADGILTHHPVLGMREEEGLLAMGKPNDESASGDAKSLTWRRPTASDVTYVEASPRSIMTDDREPLAQMNDERLSDRHFYRVVLKDGVVSKVDALE
jgi:hypothetical protein